MAYQTTAEPLDAERRMRPCHDALLGIGLVAGRMPVFLSPTTLRETKKTLKKFGGKLLRSFFLGFSFLFNLICSSSINQKPCVKTTSTNLFVFCILVHRETCGNPMDIKHLSLASPQSFRKTTLKKNSLDSGQYHVISLHLFHLISSTFR